MTSGPNDGPLGFGGGAPEPEPESRPQEPERAPAPKQPISTTRYTWFVGIAGIVLLIVVGINTLSNGTGTPGVRLGRLVPSFAAPLATKGLVGDANTCQNGDCGKSGHEPACSIRGAAIFNVCDAYAAKPLVLAFTSDDGSCIHQLDTIQRVAARFPEIGFAAVAVRGNRGDLRNRIAEHGWTFPVAYDRDNAVANAYGMIVCPQITYVRRGGRAAGTTFKDLGEAALISRLEALQSGRVVPK